MRHEQTINTANRLVGKLRDEYDNSDVNIGFSVDTHNNDIEIRFSVKEGLFRNVHMYVCIDEEISIYTPIYPHDDCDNEMILSVFTDEETILTEVRSMLKKYMAAVKLLSKDEVWNL